jgi:hypothetical protein
MLKIQNERFELMRGLHEAAEHGQAELIEELVQTEEALNQLNNGHHALWYAALLRKEGGIILQIPVGFLASLSSQNTSNKELGRQMQSLADSGKIEELLGFLIERLEKAPQESIRLLESINNNAVLRAALGLSQKNLAHDSVREDYRKLVLDRFTNLDLELKSFNGELNSLVKR